MADFTSALYLGMRHPSGSLPGWNRMTLGAPAVLAEPPGDVEAASEMASLQGCEDAVLLPSTLHLFWDLFGWLSKQRVAIFLDTGAYAIAHWGAERAQAAGVSVRQFRHFDPEALARQIERVRFQRVRPIVVADGFCPVCAKFAPLSGYAEIVRRYEGLLVLDDTQSLGIWGERRPGGAPYGYGGGGVLRYHRRIGSEILLCASLAKGFGAPLAVLSGSRETIGRFRAGSETRVHCSPPAQPVIQAAAGALHLNRLAGQRLRQRLAENVGRFCQGLAQIGLSSTGGWFPQQTLQEISGNDALRLHERLRRCGIQGVLTRAHDGPWPKLSFLLTALHSAASIDRCLDALAETSGTTAFTGRNHDHRLSLSRRSG